MRARAAREAARYVILDAAQRAVRAMPGNDPVQLQTRNQAIQDVRRIERLFGLEPAFTLN